MPVTSQAVAHLEAKGRDAVPASAVGLDERTQRTGASFKLVRRLQRIERLPESRQRVVLKFIDALIDQETAGGGRHRERS